MQKDRKEKDENGQKFGVAKLKNCGSLYEYCINCIVRQRAH